MLRLASGTGRTSPAGGRSHGATGRSRQVRFLEVGSGGVLGLLKQKVLVPVEAITSVGTDVVHVSQDRERVAGAPAYDPEVVAQRNYYEEIYGYYQYPPYWAGPFPR